MNNFSKTSLSIFLLSLLLYGCRNDFNNKSGLIIISSWTYTVKEFFYKAHPLETHQDNYYEFTDDYGKYKVGDTIYFGKK